MRIDLVLMFGSRCREVVRYFLLVCFVCLTGGSVSGQAHSPLVTITGEVRDADGELGRDAQGGLQLSVDGPVDERFSGRGDRAERNFFGMCHGW